MKKRFKIQGLQCANCGNKIEGEIKKLDGVMDANVSFLTEKAKFELEDDADVDEILEKANEIADRVEPGCQFIAK